MTSGAAILVSAGGTALNAVYAWPQVARARRTTAGLSAATTFLGYESRLAWTGYAATRHDLGLLAGQAPPAMAFFMLIVVMSRQRPESRIRIWISLGLLTIATLAMGYCRPLLACVAVTTAALTAVPQLLALRTGQAAGVSAGMYVIAAAASASWLTYGLLVGDLTICLPNFLVLPTTILVAIWTMQRAGPARWCRAGPAASATSGRGRTSG
jgi:uncharacterized protein with PQ loop repeat